MGKNRGGYYAVARGRNVGIYGTWDECKLQVDGYPCARFKKFGSETEARNFIDAEGGQTSSSSAATGASIPSIMAPPSSGFSRKYSSTSRSSNGNEKPAASNVFVGFSSITQPSSTPGQTRQFSTTKPAEKRKISMTDERIVNKRTKQAGEDNSGVDLSKFSVDDSGYVVVYTDGACSANGRSGAQAGIGVWFGDDNKLNISEPVRGRATNNTAEIQAAERAIRQAKSQGITKLNVKTDSQFLIKCVTEWMNKWQRNGWKLTDGKPVINRNDLEKLNEATADMNVKWSYVPGHKGHYGNECADRLAVSGASRYQ